jgi:selenocysteine lyase/cysteine desulfurase
MSDFHAAYPDYVTTSRLDDLRATEYSYLDRGGHTYLDYTGAGLPADEGAFEDGTLNFLAIPDVTTGLARISDIGIDLIHRRVGYLTGWLLDCLAGLKHGNGAPMVRLYGPPDVRARGGTVAFNFLDPGATWWTNGSWRGTPARRASRCGPAASATRARASGRSA